MLNSHFFPKNYNPHLTIRPHSRTNSHQSEGFTRKIKLSNPAQIPKTKVSQSLQNYQKRSRSMTITLFNQPEQSKRHIVLKSRQNNYNSQTKSNNFINRKRQRMLVVKGYQKQPTLDLSLQKFAKSPRNLVSMNSYRFRNLRNKKQGQQDINNPNKTMQLLMVKKYSRQMAVKGWEFQDDQYTTDLF